MMEEELKWGGGRCWELNLAVGALKPSPLTVELLSNEHRMNISTR